MPSGFLLAIEDGRMRRLASGQGRVDWTQLWEGFPHFGQLHSAVTPQCFPHKSKVTFCLM